MKILVTVLAVLFCTAVTTLTVWACHAAGGGEWSRPVIFVAWLASAFLGGSAVDRAWEKD
jgi:hypothetical protein